MKLPKLIFMVLILILFIPFNSVSVFAVTIPPKNTEASVSFTETGDAGSQLTLDDVPNLDFGQQTVSLEDQNYLALTTDPSVTVTDERSVSYAQGWNVTVSSSKFYHFTDDIHTIFDKTLDGAQITFSTSGTPSQSPSLGFQPPTTPSSFTITADGSVGTTKIITAEATKGRGTWVTTWPKGNVTLNIPGGKMDAIHYYSKLTWTLVDAP